MFRRMLSCTMPHLVAPRRVYVHRTGRRLSRTYLLWCLRMVFPFRLHLLPRHDVSPLTEGLTIKRFEDQKRSRTRKCLERQSSRIEMEGGSSKAPVSKPPPSESVWMRRLLVAYREPVSTSLVPEYLAGKEGSSALCCGVVIYPALLGRRASVEV